MISEILKKERALDEIDRMEKLKRKDEQMKNSEFLKYKMQLKKEEEEWMDKLADEEREKEERIKKNKELNDYREFQRQQELKNLERINELNKLEKEKLKKQWEIDEQNGTAIFDIFLYL